MICEIITDKDFLQQVAEPATAEDETVAIDLLDTMNAQENCACLAANQIGSRKAVIAYRDESDRIHIMYNPALKQSFIAYKAVEGCMSLGDETTEVKRFHRITVTYQVLENGTLVNRQRKLTEWSAEVVQHAIDHCNGILV